MNRGRGQNYYRNGGRGQNYHRNGGGRGRGHFFPRGGQRGQALPPQGAQPPDTPAQQDLTQPSPPVAQAQAQPNYAPYFPYYAQYGNVAPTNQYPAAMYPQGFWGGVPYPQSDACTYVIPGQPQMVDMNRPPLPYSGGNAPQQPGPQVFQQIIVVQPGPQGAADLLPTLSNLLQAGPIQTPATGVRISEPNPPPSTSRAPSPPRAPGPSGVATRQDVKPVCDFIDLSDDEDAKEAPELVFKRFETEIIIWIKKKLGSRRPCQFEDCLNAMEHFSKAIDNAWKSVTLKDELQRLVGNFINFIYKKCRKIDGALLNRYLDLMTRLLVQYFRLIRLSVRTERRQTKSVDTARHSRRMIYLALRALFRRMDSIMHLIFKAPAITKAEEPQYADIWSEFLLWFLTTPSYNKSRNDVYRSFIAWQKLRAMRPLDEREEIDKLSCRYLGVESYNELTDPRIRQILDKFRTDGRMTVRDMIAMYWNWREEFRTDLTADSEEPSIIRGPPRPSAPDPAAAASSSSSSTRTDQASKKLKHEGDGLENFLPSFDELIEEYLNNLPTGPPAGIVAYDDSEDSEDESSGLVENLRSACILSKPGEPDCILILDDDEDDKEPSPSSGQASPQPSTSKQIAEEAPKETPNIEAMRLLTPPPDTQEQTTSEAPKSVTPPPQVQNPEEPEPEPEGPCDKEVEAPSEGPNLSEAEGPDREEQGESIMDISSSVPEEEEPSVSAQVDQEVGEVSVEDGAVASEESPEKASSVLEEPGETAKEQEVPLQSEELEAKQPEEIGALENAPAVPLTGPQEDSESLSRRSSPFQAQEVEIAGDPEISREILERYSPQLIEEPESDLEEDLMALETDDSENSQEAFSVFSRQRNPLLSAPLYDIFGETSPLAEFQEQHSADSKSLEQELPVGDQPIVQASEETSLSGCNRCDSSPKKTDDSLSSPNVPSASPEEKKSAPNQDEDSSCSEAAPCRYTPLNRNEVERFFDDFSKAQKARSMGKSRDPRLAGNSEVAKEYQRSRGEAQVKDGEEKEKDEREKGEENNLTKFWTNFEPQEEQVEQSHQQSSDGATLPCGSQPYSPDSYPSFNGTETANVYTPILVNRAVVPQPSEVPFQAGVPQPLKTNNVFKAVNSLNLTPSPPHPNRVISVHDFEKKAEELSKRVYEEMVESSNPRTRKVHQKQERKGQQSNREEDVKHITAEDTDPFQTAKTTISTVPEPRKNSVISVKANSKLYQRGTKEWGFVLKQAKNLNAGKPSHSEVQEIKGRPFEDKKAVINLTDCRGTAQYRRAELRLQEANRWRAMERARLMRQKMLLSQVRDALECVSPSRALQGKQSQRFGFIFGSSYAFSRQRMKGTIEQRNHRNNQAYSEKGTKAPQENGNHPGHRNGHLPMEREKRIIEASQIHSGNENNGQLPSGKRKSDNPEKKAPAKKVRISKTKETVEYTVGEPPNELKDLKQQKQTTAVENGFGISKTKRSGRQTPFNV